MTDGAPAATELSDLDHATVGDAGMSRTAAAAKATHAHLLCLSPHAIWSALKLTGADRASLRPNGPRLRTEQSVFGR